MSLLHYVYVTAAGKLNFNFCYYLFLEPAAAGFEPSNSGPWVDYSMTMLLKLGK